MTKPNTKAAIRAHLKRHAPPGCHVSERAVEDCHFAISLFNSGQSGKRIHPESERDTTTAEQLINAMSLWRLVDRH